MKYFVTILLLFCFSANAETIVISDIDNTIKKSGSGSIKRAILNKLRKSDSPYPILNEVYKNLAANGAKFFYLSLSLKETSSIKEWLIKYNFPGGTISQRNINSSIDSKKFKKQKLHQYLQNISKEAKIYFWGDNQEFDPEVYQEVAKELQLEDYHIYIRDITTHDTFWGMDLFYKPNGEIKFFQRDLDLFNIKKCESF